MPIYEYRCDACENGFEILTSFAERDRPHVCPSCESLQTHVVVSTFARTGGGESPAPVDFSSGGGCACGGSCSCRS